MSVDAELLDALRPFALLGMTGRLGKGIWLEVEHDPDARVDDDDLRRAYLTYARHDRGCVEGFHMALGRTPPPVATALSVAKPRVSWQRRLPTAIWWLNGVCLGLLIRGAL